MFLRHFGDGRCGSGKQLASGERKMPRGRRSRTRPAAFHPPRRASRPKQKSGNSVLQPSKPRSRGVPDATAQARTNDRSHREARCRSRRSTPQIADQGAGRGPLLRGRCGSSSAAAQVAGGRPAKLPPDRSVFSASGTTTVNDKPVAEDTLIRPGDTVRTGKNSEIIFVVSDCSMLLRADSQLLLEGQPTGRLVGFKLLVGKLLSVYPPGPGADRDRHGERSDPRHRRVRRVRSGTHVLLHLLRRDRCRCEGRPGQHGRPYRRRHHDRPLYIAGGREESRQQHPPGKVHQSYGRGAQADRDPRRPHAAVELRLRRPRYQTPKGGTYRP